MYLMLGNAWITGIGKCTLCMVMRGLQEQGNVPYMLGNAWITGIGKYALCLVMRGLLEQGNVPYAW